MNRKAIKKVSTHDAAALLTVSYKAAQNTPLALLNAQTYHSLFGMFMANSQTGCWIYDEHNNIVFANEAYTNLLYDGKSPVGKHINDVLPEKLSKKLIARNKEVIKTGKPAITEYTYTKANGDTVHFVSNAFTFTSAEGKQYVGGQSLDISERKKAEEQLQKIHDRYKYVIHATSEAIWDCNLKTNEIYRSDAFYKISGYNKQKVVDSLAWWLENIHPDDKDQVRKNIDDTLNAGKTNWQNEYRFKYADGTYHYILDNGFAVYENKKAVRLIGSIQDITEHKLLELQLRNELVQKQKLINQATIDAQEKERSMISGELHDNVNQLLMSAKLHICAAKNNKAANELIDKASEYILEAVEEIRNLSKKLNSSIVKTVGLENSIRDICRNMRQFNDMEVTTFIKPKIIDKLSQEQQLVFFRIIQEQSSNIIKHSRATRVTINLSEKNNQSYLTISDNGIGFDKEKQKVKGIGFINIFNRIDAYNGRVEIVSSPDNGCTLHITMPFGL
jgi:PAS domain S-box-containing protein